MRCWHKWGRWTPYRFAQEVWPEGEGGKVSERHFTLRQYRACLRCGFAQDEIIAFGTGGPDIVVPPEADEPEEATA